MQPRDMLTERTRGHGWNMTKVNNDLCLWDWQGLVGVERVWAQAGSNVI